MQMLSIPLNKRYFYEAHAAYRLALIQSTCGFKPTIWAQSYPRKHTNCTTPLQERHLPTPLRHAEKQPLYWNWATLPLQSSSEFFTSTANI